MHTTHILPGQQQGHTARYTNYFEVQTTVKPLYTVPPFTVPSLYRAPIYRALLLPCPHLPCPPFTVPSIYCAPLHTDLFCFPPRGTVNIDLTLCALTITKCAYNGKTFNRNFYELVLGNDYSDTNSKHYDKIAN